MHLPAWLTKPEVLFGTALTIFCFLASLYAPEIRRGLKWPGQKMSRKMIESLLKFSENQLGVLERIHGNAYNLVLFLAWTLLSALKSLALAVVLGVVVSIVGYFVTKDIWFVSPFSFFGVAVGSFGGTATRTYGILEALYDYESAVAGLRKNIEQCKAMLNQQ